MDAQYVGLGVRDGVRVRVGSKRDDSKKKLR